MSNTADTATVVDVTTHGEFPGAVEYAKAKIGSVARLTRRPMSHARVRLTRSHRAAAEKPVIAQANVDFGGRVVRAQVEARGLAERGDLVGDAGQLRGEVGGAAAHRTPSGQGRLQPAQGAAAADQRRRGEWVGRPRRRRCRTLDGELGHGISSR
ncbi:hypothetical protein [Dermacoccus nishinomiyaensis]|uniref:hypothetical protein n=1 Tax=Dermacoccus nishinomiyaensis TaxID=1274 RepID=UPI00248F0176|nr:hypothetical protein [Dermacoccus nishinomiyaensis]